MIKLTYSSALLMKMVVIVLRIVRMKAKEVSINISLLFGLYFNDFGSWTIAKGEGKYKWVHFFFASHDIVLKKHSKENDCTKPCTIKAAPVHFNTNVKVELV